MVCFSFRFFFAIVLSFLLAATPLSAHATTTIVALGDSLTAGLGLRKDESFPAQLEQVLHTQEKDVTVINGGVSGDTTAGGKSRLEWVLSQKPQIVIVELGANDMLRGVNPKVTRANLDSILQTLTQNNIVVVFAGMKAASNLGPAYAFKFNGVYPALARKYRVEYMPFFLEDVALDPELNQPDGLHPTAMGVGIIVKNILPYVERALERVEQSKKN